MSFTMDSQEQADITYLFEKIHNNTGNRDVAGYGRATYRVIPWSFLRLSDTGEDRKYVMPIPPTAMSIGGGRHLSQLRDLTYADPPVSLTQTFGASFFEFAEFAPFPYEKYRSAASAGGNDDAISGPIAVHFYGGI